MDGEVPFIVESGLIVGQWWRSVEHPHISLRIRRILTDDDVVMDMPPKLVNRRMLITDLLAKYELVKPARLHPYTHSDGGQRVQILSYCGLKKRDREIWHPIAEFKV